MAQDPSAIRRDIVAMYERIQNEDFYQLLEVDRDADAALVANRFRQLAKLWHIDRFSGVELGEEKPKIQEIFATLNRAHRTLSDPDARADYDLQIEMEEGPNLDALLQAENNFLQAKNMLQAGSYKGAHELMRQANELNPDEIEYRAYFLYTEFLLMEKDEQGHAKNRGRAKAIYEELDTISETLSGKDWMLTFLGSVALGLGRDHDAEGLFAEALQVNSRNHSAQRQLRLLRMRRQSNSKSGIFERILSRFK